MHWKRGSSLKWGLVAAVVLAPVATANLVTWLFTAWPTFGHSPQHDGLSAFPAQPLQQVKWSTPVDLAPQYSGNNLLIHYGSPLCTPANNVIVTVKVNPTGTFRVESHAGANGALQWTVNTDYVLPPHTWVPSVGPTLTPRRKVVIPAIGGTVLQRSDADLTTGTVTRFAFYGLANYNAAPSTYDANVIINTPIVCDNRGNSYFGFVVLGPTPIGLQSGLARLTQAGVGTWTSAAAAANDASIQQVPHNCAPALSYDGSIVYVGVRDGSSHGYLVGLDSTTLAPVYRVRLKDPLTNNDSNLFDEGTASPCVARDGDVFYGVLENPFGTNHLRGWMLHFDGALTQTKLPGAFGWDNTPSIVPRQAVPSYTGSAQYLVLTKYNDYAQGGGQGINRVAVLDPTTSQVDPVSGALVMREVITVAGPTPDPSWGALAVKEWCINSTAIDPFTRCAIVNSEDGKVYRWDFTSNQLLQPVVLTPGIGEAYTPTIIGVDGTAYAINNGTLFAVGQ